jgi:hypothetical protein
MFENDKKPPRVVMAGSLIKDRSVITLNGETIRNTPEDPKAVERYLASKRR